MSYFNTPPASGPIPNPLYAHHAAVAPEVADYWQHIQEGIDCALEANDIAASQRRAMEQATADAANRIRWTQQMR